MKTTLNIDDDLLHDAKRLAAERKTTLTKLVEEGLRHVVNGRVSTGEPYKLELIMAPPGFTVDFTTRAEMYERYGDRWDKFEAQQQGEAHD